MPRSRTNNNNSNNNATALPPTAINDVRPCIDIRHNNITCRRITAMWSSCRHSCIILQTTTVPPPTTTMRRRMPLAMLSRKKRNDNNNNNNDCTIPHYGIWPVKRFIPTPMLAIIVVIAPPSHHHHQHHHHPPNRPHRIYPSIGPPFYLMVYHPIPNRVVATINN